MTTEHILTTRGLTMRFGGVTAVDNVDFNLRDGELRCLLGPNGAGKSTFFKCLTGQLTPTEGKITFAGQDVTGALTHQIVNLGVGIKTQVPNVFDGISAYENVRLSARRKHLAPMARELTHTTLERCGITHLAKREVGLLSHGQRQLVELAMVLAGEPKLILLDEPAAGMTGDERDRLAQLVLESARSAAVVVVEHDMAFIRQIAKFVTVFNRGAIFREAMIDDIMQDREVQEIYLGKQANVAAA
ncbi:ABC transporter ATP-binding protein [Salipiger bermudensis]|uniref:ABC-type transport system ATP-binding protein II (Probable substrates urea/short chain-amides) n=1 Tax=Salipiger bermudensis (strain DSM 26914 / JCM 13377 / KCTC 12554 / HTCC2601) TaxID=314265 RepID=Q0FRL9_SALBH|nr:ABC transporter ATP-binding protein [Salipiger bermudensis]MAE88157.1 ABC transporter ATP-binding protein [Pelagibaca sp.]MBR9892954.1 ABC transporter ATP-binding protein [bacterium]EAU46835.1 ABC-type transport system ATP-binding protein II (probable substrates urea/short chain-amides) [Salipiger bermudensis HTCC2601]MBN9676051.1 ABC transporter ATP-binding protein [Salipiger bermudensis]MCA1287849.1 ABC transporter ATP-binding protein [Salipiger bermudensis]